MKAAVDKERTSRARARTLMSPESLWHGFLFAFKAMIYFAICAELVLLAFVLKALIA